MTAPRCRLCRVALAADVAGICADGAACNARRYARGQRWRWLMLALIALPGGLPLLALAALIVALYNSRQGARRAVLSQESGDNIRADS